MLLSPYFWLILAGLMAGCWVGGCTHERKVFNEYKAEVEADRKMRVATVARIDKERNDAIAGVTTDAAKKDASRDAAFAALHRRNSALESSLASVRVDRALLDSLRNSVSTANGSDTRSSGEPAEAASSSTDATGSAVSDWFEQVAGLYARCRDQVGNLISAYDKVRAAH